MGCPLAWIDEALNLYGVFTLRDTENETDNYGAGTLSLMPLATFSLFIGLGIGFGFGVVQCEHIISM